MSKAIVRKDLLLLRRDQLLRGLFFVTTLLVLASVLTSLQRDQVFAKEKSAALEADRAVWMNQGERNPHSAAHFSRYAFRPLSPLAMIDPGISDFAGLAVWLEAHYQDPAVFRRAEDAGELSRHAQLTPALLVLIVGPLIVFLMLFGSIASEREDGTLRQLLATGVDTWQLVRGKCSAGIRVTLFGYSLVFAPVAVLAAVLSPSDFASDAWLRLFSLYLTYAAYLVVFVAIAIGVSALFRTRQAAFLALTVLWTLMAIVVPRLAADTATTFHPQPDARTVAVHLRAASDIYFRDTDRREQIEADVLERYGVSSVEELPIDYGAYVLQVSEELSNPEFDRVYSDLDSRYAGQESVVRSFSLLSPAIAAANLSRGVAGTDRIHQREFVRAAELHRRDMIRMLNEDYMYNADGAGYSYTAGAEVWGKFHDLDYHMPTLGRVAAAYALDAIWLVAWFVLAFGFAYWSVRRAVLGEETAS